MARSLLYRPEAGTDIEDIANYTIERWGPDQAQSYVATLRKDIESLVKFSKRYPLYEASDIGLRRMTSGHHLVFYVVTDEAVDIVRILHERMDFDQNLV